MTPTLQLLSRASIILYHTQSLPEIMAAQRYLARQFFSAQTLDAVNAIIRADPIGGEHYLFTEQAFLTAMCLVALKDRGSARRLPELAPFERVGEALLHINDRLDSTQRTDLKQSDALTQIRELTKFALRNGIFNATDDHRYALVRLVEMFDVLAPRLKSHPSYVDVSKLFRLATGMRLRTYLAMGNALLSNYAAISVATGDSLPVFVHRRECFRRTRLRRASVRFFRLLATNRGRFRKAWRADTQRHGRSEYGFLEAERHPLVEVRKDHLCCLSLRLLERKFETGPHFQILDSLAGEERRRYLRFWGAIFEQYVQQLCERAFGDRFLAGFKYRGKDGELEAADGWILYPDAAIILDAKIARFSLDLRLTGDLDHFHKRLDESILRGARGLDRVITDFAEGRVEHARFKGLRLRELYPLIVTFEDIPVEHFIGSYIQRLVEEHGLFAQPSARPLTIMHIRDLENCEAAVQKGASLLAMMKDKVRSIRSRQTSFHNFLFERFPDGLPQNQILIERCLELWRETAGMAFGPAAAARLGRE